MTPLLTLTTKWRGSVKKVSVVGLSMGGALTCLLAEHRPVHKAVPIAPALKILQHGSRLAKYFLVTGSYLAGQR